MSRIKERILLKMVLPCAEVISGTCATKWLKAISEMNRWSKQRLVDWQNQQLSLFVKHAYEHTKYYRQLFDSLHLSPDDIRCAEDLKRIPIITKEIVRDHYDELIPDDLDDMQFRTCTSGGTTGVPIRYLCSEDVWGYITAAKIYYWKRTGYRYGDAFIALGSASLFSKKASWTRRLYDKIRNERPLNCVNLTDSICFNYYLYIKRHGIKYLYGYSAAIFIFASFLERENLDLSQISAVFTTSENLPDHYRELIERVFQCEVVDCYGARDAGITAYEVGRNSYNIGFNVIAEVINEIAPNTGSLVSTSFLNHCFPLIRYYFGDEAELAGSTEESSYNGQTLRNIIGRSSHVLRLENGHSLTATGVSMIMKEFDIIAFDFYKDGTNSVCLRIEPDKDGYTEAQEHLIVKTFKKYIGEDCALHIVYVDEFPTLHNGKRNYFIV